MMSCSSATIARDRHLRLEADGQEGDHRDQEHDQRDQRLLGDVPAPVGAHRLRADLLGVDPGGLGHRGDDGVLARRGQRLGAQQDGVAADHLGAGDLRAGVLGGLPDLG